MKRVTRYIDRTLEVVLVCLLAIMVLTVTWQVATRYLLNSPSSFTEELATYLLIWISLLGSAHALRIRAHLGVDVVTRRLKGASRQTAWRFVHVVIIVFAAVVFVYGGGHLMYVTLKLDQTSAALQVPVGLVYSVIPISGLLIIFYSSVAMVEGDHRTSDGSGSRMEGSA